MSVLGCICDIIDAAWTVRDASSSRGLMRRNMNTLAAITCCAAVETSQVLRRTSLTGETALVLMEREFKMRPPTAVSPRGVAFG
jgi:hypothetical protein